MKIKHRLTGKVLLEVADLRHADLRDANLSDADLRHADLHGADLHGADLYGADLRHADLHYADLRDADLSGAKNMFCEKKWLSQFKSDEKGIYVYKDVKSTFYKKPWKVEKLSFLEENVNKNVTDSCGCGVNFATMDWLKLNSYNEVWKCLIHWEDVHSIVIPYNTDGKARCARLQLIGKI